MLWEGFFLLSFGVTGWGIFIVLGFTSEVPVPYWGRGVSLALFIIGWWLTDTASRWPGLNGWSLAVSGNFFCRER